MNVTKGNKRKALVSLTIGGAMALCAASFGAAVGAPAFSLADPGDGEAEWTAKDETTIKLRLDQDDPIVLKLEDMRVGDTRSFRENGKDVTVTRDDDGYLVTVDGKEIRVLAGEGSGGHLFVMGGKPGEAGKKLLFHSIDTGDSKDGKTHKRVVVREGGPGLFAFRTGDAKAVKGAELLEKAELESLRGADRRTQDAVAKALDELIAKGLVIAPGCALPSITATGGGEGAVEIQVERRKTEAK